MNRTILLLLNAIIIQLACSTFIYAPIIIRPIYPDFGNSNTDGPNNDLPEPNPYPEPPIPNPPFPEPLPWPTDEPREVVLYQSADCSPKQSLYRIPITSGCQQIPSWILDDNWKLGVKVPSRVSIKFYADSDCSEFLPEEAVPQPRRFGSEPQCTDLGGLNLTPRSFTQF